jgi:hypothetical protein
MWETDMNLSWENVIKKIYWMILNNVGKSIFGVQDWLYLKFTKTLKIDTIP